MRLTVGAPAPSFDGKTLAGTPISLESFRGRSLLLKFYRFATCPVCNLHVHHFVRDYAAVAAAGLDTVVFFHSPEEKLASSRTEPVPFHLVADPDKTAFRSYGVETGARGFFSPRVMRDYVSALRAGYPTGMFTSDGGILGNPADFIVGPDGTLLYAHYGVEYADSLTAAAIVEAFEGLRGERAA